MLRCIDRVYMYAHTLSILALTAASAAAALARTPHFPGLASRVLYFVCVHVSLGTKMAAIAGTKRGTHENIYSEHRHD